MNKLKKLRKAELLDCLDYAIHALKLYECPFDRVATDLSGRSLIEFDRGREAKKALEYITHKGNGCSK